MIDLILLGHNQMNTLNICSDLVTDHTLNSPNITGVFVDPSGRTPPYVVTK